DIVLHAFQITGSNPDRLTYALAGLVFSTTSPLPYGGKKKPGFFAFQGATAGDVLDWILQKAVEPPKRGRGKRGILPAGGALKYIADQVNDLLQWQRSSGKDIIDDAVLRGLTRSGHSSNYPAGRTVLPHHLRANSNEGASALKVVEFTKTQHVTLTLQGRPVLPVSLSAKSAEKVDGRLAFDDVEGRKSASEASLLNGSVVGELSDAETRLGREESEGFEQMDRGRSLS
ncbi:hypothetical protein HDU67_005700, partial [Dinochytrium kinnereticum]